LLGFRIVINYLYCKGQNPMEGFMQIYKQDKILVKIWVGGIDISRKY